MDTSFERLVGRIQMALNYQSRDEVVLILQKEGVPMEIIYFAFIGADLLIGYPHV